MNNKQMQIMKKNLLKPVMLLFMGLAIIACSSEDDPAPDDNNNNNSTSSVDQTIAVASSGNWIITNFVDSGTNETNDFNGYTFSFNTGGALVATNGTETVTGTWSVTDSNSGSDDTNIEDDDFNIFFPVPDGNKFEDLNDDWDFISVSGTKIELIDISGGNGGTDYLTFQKQ